MIRYDTTSHGDTVDMEPAPDGLWVLYDDVQEELAAPLRDAARLDWLLDNALVIHMRHGAVTPPTMDRDGIDAAMQEPNP